MKASRTKLVTTPQTSVFPKTPHTVKPNPEAATAKAKKRDNTFSQSRDTREDRGSRQMKTSNNPQTFPHGR